MEYGNHTSSHHDSFEQTKHLFLGILNRAWVAEIISGNKTEEGRCWGGKHSRSFCRPCRIYSTQTPWETNRCPHRIIPIRDGTWSICSLVRIPHYLRIIPRNTNPPSILSCGWGFSMSLSPDSLRTERQVECTQCKSSSCGMISTHNTIPGAEIKGRLKKICPGIPVVTPTNGF